MAKKKQQICELCFCSPLRCSFVPCLHTYLKGSCSNRTLTRCFPTVDGWCICTGKPMFSVIHISRKLVVGVVWLFVACQETSFWQCPSTHCPFGRDCSRTTAFRRNGNQHLPVAPNMWMFQCDQPVMSLPGATRRHQRGKCTKSMDRGKVHGHWRHLPTFSH